MFLNELTAFHVNITSLGVCRVEMEIHLTRHRYSNSNKNQADSLFSEMFVLDLLVCVIRKQEFQEM